MGVTKIRNQAPISLPRKGAQEMEVLVGRNIQKFRLQRNMSQRELAGYLDVSFQQIQKFEKGENRISAGRLYLLAKALKVPMTSFFEANRAKKPSLEEFQELSPEAIKLALEFDRLGDRELQKALAVVLKKAG